VALSGREIEAQTLTGEAPGPPEMTATDVCDFLDVTDARGVRIWLDGGWAVDAWLGGAPRRHSDLDIVVEQKDLATVVAALTERGFEPVQRDDTRPWNFVLGDSLGPAVDFHVVELDQGGRGVYGPPENGDFWPANALDRTTTFCGRIVHASGPEWLVASHTGYQLKDKDWRDVSALCARFGLPIPSEYESFANA
jgi:lincosamide nucleotidyltransferase A/C/D/E